MPEELLICDYCAKPDPSVTLRWEPCGDGCCERPTDWLCDECAGEGDDE